MLNLLVSLLLASQYASAGASVIWFFIFVAWCTIVICLLSRLCSSDNAATAAPQTLLVAPPFVITQPQAPTYFAPGATAATGASIPQQQTELVTQSIPSTNPFQSVTNAIIPREDEASSAKDAHTQVIDLPSGKTSAYSRPTVRVTTQTPIASYFTIAEKYREEMKRREETAKGVKDVSSEDEKHVDEADETQQLYVAQHEEPQPASPSQIRLSPQHHAIEMNNVSPTAPTSVTQHQKQAHEHF